MYGYSLKNFKNQDDKMLSHPYPWLISLSIYGVMHSITRSLLPPPPPLLPAVLHPLGVAIGENSGLSLRLPRPQSI